MSVAGKSVAKPVTVAIIFIVLAILGINAFTNLPLELIPDMEIPYLVVSTSYPNASPEEVEDKLTRVLESALSSVTGLKNITSTSSEGSSSITLEFEAGTDLSDAANNARDRIDLVKNYLPSEATSPLIIQMDMTMLPVMVIALSSPFKTTDELKVLADETISPLLEQIDGVASTSVIGGRERKIRVEIPKDRLQAYNLTFSQIAQMVAAQNSNAAVGSITEYGLTYAIQTSGLFADIEAIGNTVISYVATQTGEVRQIRLEEIAEIRDTYDNASAYFTYGGQECIGISISKQSGKNTVQAAERIKSRMPSIYRALPSDCSMNIVYDSSELISETVDLVAHSALQGAILAILILLLFLREFKSTGLIAISIPMSVLVTLLVMYYAGLSLNLMTLAGLALGIGMLVDSSIVVIENIYSYRHRGVKPRVASVLGTDEMVGALLSSTLTTCCVFIPMVLYKNKLGILGSVFDQLSITVIIALLTSFVVAITLIPVISSKFRFKGPVSKQKKSAFMEKTDLVYEKFDNAYAKSIAWVLRHKILLVAVIIVMFVWACVQIPVVGFSYMPVTESKSMNVTVQMPVGTSIEETRRVATELDSRFRSQVRGLDMDAVMIGAGIMSSGSGTNSATMMYTFHKASDRQADWDNPESAALIFEALKDDYPEASITVSGDSSILSMGSSSTDVDIKISSTDMEAVKQTTLEIEALLKNRASGMLKDITTNISEGSPMISIDFDREKMNSLGVTVAAANAEIRANIGGMTAARYRESGHDIDVVLTLPQSDKQTRLDFEDIMVATNFGTRVPLASFASIREDRTATSIRRENQSRVLHVTASAVNVASTTEIQKLVQTMVEENIPAREGVVISYSGNYESMMETLQVFIEIISVAVLLVFAIMAAQFESFRKPFIVIFTLPLALIGIVAIYKIVGGLSFTVVTAVGALILVGIVVNNGIVLVDYTGLMQDRGMSLFDACVAAARSRLRPVLMTTLTTVLALVPMAFFVEEGGETIQPIGLTIFGGLTFSALMTLYLMPVLYYVFYRGKERRAQKKAKEGKR